MILTNKIPKILLSALFLCAALVGARGQVLKDNTLIVKIKENYNGQSAKTTNDMLQARMAGVGFIGAKQVFPPKPASKLNAAQKTKAEAFGLERIYKIALTGNVDVAVLAKKMAALEWVEYAAPEYTHELMYVPNDALLGNQWHHANIKSREAWDLETGSPNVTIGIVDTGINMEHPDLKPNFKYNEKERGGIKGKDDDGNGFVDDSLGYDFGDNDALAADEHGHGTFVAGFAAAKGDNGIGTAGVAYNSKLMPLKVLKNKSLLVNTYEALVYGAENGCDVINVSLGRKGFPSPYEEELIDYMMDVHDVLIVAAAGNLNEYADWYPASYKRVLSVTWSRPNDDRFYNATYSRNVDIMTPGESVWSTYGASGDGYYYGWGSSYACPITAGAAALVRTRFPSYSADQVGEVLKQTSDNKDTLSANKNYAEMLGKGRLNVFRALTEAAQKKSVRMTDFAYKGPLNNDLSPGDTVLIQASFKNILKPVTSALKIRLSSKNTFVTLLDSVFSPGALATGGMASNQSKPFRAVLGKNIPEDLGVVFRLGFTDEGYDDYQYFSLDMQFESFDVGFNNFALTVPANGRLGFSQADSIQNGIGVTYKNKQFLGQMGLMLSTGADKVSDAAYFSRTANEDDFTPVSGTYLYAENDTFASMYSEFEDFPKNPKPIGVNVRQFVKGWFQENHRDYLYLEYEITNKGTAALPVLYTGLFADWDLPRAKNLAEWDSVGQFGYVRSDSGGNYVAIKAINPNRSYYAFDKKAAGNILENNFTTDEKHKTLSQGISQKTAGGSAGSDVGQISGAALHDFKPGETRTVVYVLFGGDSLPALRAAWKSASDKAYFYYRNAKAKAFAETPFCGYDSAVVTAGSGKIFNWYDKPDLKTPLHIGKDFRIAAKDTLKSFYVTDIQNPLESVADTFKIKMRPRLSAEFTQNHTAINILVTDTVRFTGPTAVSWLWDFGNGTKSTLQSPFAIYKDTGNYVVSLVITDAYGCVFRSPQHKVRVYWDPFTGTDADAEDDLILYPNPVGGDGLYLSIPEALSGKLAGVSVYSIDGKTLYSLNKKDLEGLFRVSLNSDSLQNGAYICWITLDNGHKIRRRFVVSK